MTWPPRLGFDPLVYAVVVLAIAFVVVVAVGLYAR